MRLFEKLHDPEFQMPLVMGILNVTPDSFSDGGQYSSLEKIEYALEQMQKAGVDVVDVGGESTRPGATTVTLQEELDRVMPVIELIKNSSDLSISVDTYKTQVMKEAINLGVDLINDINALQSDGAEELIAQSNVMVCLMHKQGEPETMQQTPFYNDVFAEVFEFLSERAKSCEHSGISPANILVDPGFGFGKTLDHNVKLFEQLEQFSALNYPLLIGVSRKKMIGELLGGLPVEQRMIGSVSAAVMAAMKGARVVRVHDYEETLQALKVMYALL